MAKNKNNSQTFTITDLIIGDLLRRNSAVPIKIVVTEDSVLLQIGPRDWSWDRATGEFVGSGTLIS